MTGGKSLRASLGLAWASLGQGIGPVGAAGLCGLLVVLPLLPELVPAFLVIFLAGTAIRHRRAMRWPPHAHWNNPLAWMAAFYLLHVLAMAWTSNVGFGLFDLQVKASLLVVPLLAMVLPPLRSDVRDAAFFVAALANAAAVAICLLAAVARLAGEDGLGAAQELYSSRFAMLVHPSYLAMYLVFSLATWLLAGHHRAVSAKVGLPVLVLLCTGVVLAGSKVGWIALVVTLAGILSWRWNDRALRRLLLGLAAGSFLGLALLVLLSPYASSRIKEAFAAATTAQVDAHAETSSAVRRITWAAAINLIGEHPLIGTGTGDIKDELMRVYADRHEDWVLEHRLNAHSQFLQSAACLGVAGGLLLAGFLLLPLTGRWRKDPVAVLFLLICLLNWAVESMLEVQAGVVWTAVMAFLLFQGEAENGQHGGIPG